MITIDASGSTGMDFEAFIRGGFLADTSGGGMPVFDNSSAFAGEEMMIGFGSEASSKYVLAHGDLSYNFGTHTVAGEINTIEYGTRGTGTYDADGSFVGGDALLRITGLDLVNGVPASADEEAEIEANGPVHNFAVAHMYGSAAEQARLDLYADALDADAQHFIGSAGADVFEGTSHDDILEGAGERDWLAGAKGADTVSGGDGADWLKGGGGRDVITGSEGADKLWGQAGADRFVFAEAGHIGEVGAGDVIKDFRSGADRIDLAGLDADTVVDGDQAFVFIGAEAFGGTAGELRFQVGREGARTLVEGDLDGDGVADFSLKLLGNHALSAADFAL
jgi:Ca2+-binding RTX toxin-like protein